MRPNTLTFELPVNGALYAVRATPYILPSKETRFRVSINDSPVYVFGWDNQLDRFSVLEDAPAKITDKLEMVIAGKLQSNTLQKHAA